MKLLTEQRREMDAQRKISKGDKLRRCLSEFPKRLCILLALLLCSCGGPAHKHKYPDGWHHKPTKAPLMPKDRGCGQDIPFENGETWNYPCWPWKAEPKCVSGCKP